MATLTIRMPEDKVNRLKIMAKSRGVSVNKLIEEWSNMAIAEFDARASFLARAARGSRERGLAALNTLKMRDDDPAFSSYSLHEPEQSPGPDFSSFKKKDEKGKGEP